MWSSNSPDADTRAVLTAITNRLNGTGTSDAVRHALHEPKPLFIEGWELWPAIPAPISSYLDSREFADARAGLPVEQIGS